MYFYVSRIYFLDGKGVCAQTECSNASDRYSGHGQTDRHDAPEINGFR